MATDWEFIQQLEAGLEACGSRSLDPACSE
ncbi:hypothetical protein EYZ11_001220 [Aspergillus tanneri]|uniref:Uncharacterized protein n=1 Tax=Aspergillus tanneri TaxID=1220188 RepID=A0A4S3JV62_9EURO|nr:hypothetical protein EYZ11_001220 [Aspergillus tanneri]